MSEINAAVAPGALTKRGEPRSAAAYVREVLGGCVALLYCAAIARLILPAVWLQRQDLKRVERDLREAQKLWAEERRLHLARAAAALAVACAVVYLWMLFA